VSKRLRMTGILVAGALTALALVACGGGSTGDVLSGDIEVDGSSTVFPITEAVAEEFRRGEPGVQVNVGVSGTGGGFKRFVAGETDISDASRPIKSSEAEAAAKNGVEYIEMRVGTDGLSVVVNPANTFVDCLTVAELKKIWEPGSTIDNWSQVRAGFPDQRLRLYGPGTDSGTFDYFTEEIVGEVQASRADYTASEDDNVLVQGVGGDGGALGYFGFAYYVENASRVKAVAIDSGNGCVEPTVGNIEAGEYTPLSRPLFIYVNKASLAKPEVAAFIRFYMEHGAELTEAVGYVASDASIYAENLAAAGL
jgi:phosphate transport system substrate-binding protein